ncbi:MAG: MFS transporter [bacterium]|jgi:MFS family permease
MSALKNGGIIAAENRYFQRVLSSLRNRNYRIYWIGQSVSLIGTWMQSTAQGWLILQLTNSSFYLGLVSALGTLPVLFFSLFGGAIADRVPKRKLLLFTQTSLAIPALILGVLVLTNRVEIWHVMLLAFFLGLMNAIDAPTRQSFIIELVGKDLLMNAIGLNSISFNIARILGPVVAGILIAVVGLPYCFIINGLSFFATITALLLMRIPDVARASKGEEIWKSVKDGLRFVRTRLDIFSLLAIVASSSIFAFSYTTLMPIFARDVLNSGATGLGGLMSAVGVGALLGAFNVAALSTRGRGARVAFVANLTLSLSLALFSFSRWYWLSTFFLAGVGFSMITQNSTVNNLIQTNTPDHMRGRVMGLYNITFMGLAPLGNLLAGTIAQFLGAPVAVLIGAFANAFLVILLFRLRPEMKNLS